MNRRVPVRSSAFRAALWNYQRHCASSTEPQPLALTRKDALFAGSDRGGQIWELIASVVELCKPNGVDPQGYLADVIGRIVGGHPPGRLDELLPRAYPNIPGLKAAA